MDNISIHNDLVAVRDHIKDHVAEHKKEYAAAALGFGAGALGAGIFLALKYRGTPIIIWNRSCQPIKVIAEITS